MVELDDLDRRIMELLLEDARLSYREIAKRLGVSHASVSSRIRRLEEEKVIRGYSTILDPEVLDLYPLCIRISAASGAELSEMGREIADLDRIYVVLRVSGECELLVLAMCRDRREAIEILSKISRIRGIEKAESHVVLETIKMSGRRLKD
ncbi:AsnC family transcriptional regulator [Candidatus Bathyarchaeota archaeon]|nr:MAG: AsnC family transcriptional regulator [Candidatus Bathyarchaeota archaeon]